MNTVSGQTSRYQAKGFQVTTPKVWGGIQESERIKRAEKNRKAAWFSCSAEKISAALFFQPKIPGTQPPGTNLTPLLLLDRRPTTADRKNEKINSRNPPALLHHESTTPRVCDVSRSRCTTPSRLARVSYVKNITPQQSPAYNSVRSQESYSVYRTTRRLRACDVLRTTGEKGKKKL